MCNILYFGGFEITKKKLKSLAKKNQPVSVFISDIAPLTFGMSRGAMPGSSIRSTFRSSSNDSIIDHPTTTSTSTSMADNPIPVRIDGEPNQAFMARMQAYQQRINDAIEPEQTFGAKKICGSCGKANGAATKHCPCGNNLNLSQTPSAIASRKQRAKIKAAVLAKHHDTCAICRNPLGKGNRDLGVSMCYTPTTRGNGSVYNRLNPCGRAMHLKCLKKQYNQSTGRQGDLGVLPNKCANCNMKTKSPHFIELFIPRK